MKTKPWGEVKALLPDTVESRATYERERKEALAEIVSYTLGELRKLRAVTQAELAHRLGVTQPSLSGVERRTDVQLSTLRDYVEGLGGHLEVTAVFDDVSVPVDLESA